MLRCAALRVGKAAIFLLSKPKAAGKSACFKPCSLRAGIRCRLCGLPERSTKISCPLSPRAGVKPPFWSEHIAFTRAGGRSIGHLAPMPRTNEAIEAIARNVERAHRAIPTSLILENITEGFVSPGAEMDEPEFVAGVLEASGCGWLCDVANLWTNAVNQGRDWRAELERWPWQKAVQAHFAGGRQGRDGEWIDSHDRPTPPEAFALMAELGRRGALRGAILERDEDLPPFDEMLVELDRARSALGWN